MEWWSIGVLGWWWVGWLVVGWLVVDGDRCKV